MTAKLTEPYNQEYSIWTRTTFSKTEFGFEGDYICKTGVVSCGVYQDCQEQYYMQLTKFINGREYTRGFQCSEKPSYRLVAKRAKQFIEETEE